MDFTARRKKGRDIEMVAVRVEESGYGMRRRRRRWRCLAPEVSTTVLTGITFDLIKFYIFHQTVIETCSTEQVFGTKFKTSQRIRPGLGCERHTPKKKKKKFSDLNTSYKSCLELSGGNSEHSMRSVSALLFSWGQFFNFSFFVWCKREKKGD